MQQSPFFSIIITNKNAHKWLAKCLTSVYEQSYTHFEVIFVDDGSTDASLQYVKDHFSKAIIVENLENVGFARANNIGATAARGDYLFILNADTYLNPDTLEKAADYIKDHPKHAYMQLDIRKYDKSNMEGEACIFGMDKLGYPIWKGSGELFYADAAAMIITRSLFFKLHGFDEAFFIYLEDLDLAWRARLCGETVHMIEKAYVYHFAGGTSVSTQNKKGSYITSLRRRFDAQKNNIRSIIKNFELKNVLWALPVSCVLASGEGFLYLVSGNVAGFITLHRSIIWNLTHLADTLKVRAYIQNSRKINDATLYKSCDSRISKLHSLLLFGIPSMKT